MLLLALGGCKLIDQRTFAPKPVAPAPPTLASLPPVTGRVALLTISYAKSAPDWGDALRTAVGAAETKRPGTRYDVVAVVPTATDPALQLRDLAQARQNAATVMRAMMALGVRDTRIALGAETVPGLKAREVRVYLR